VTNHTETNQNSLVVPIISAFILIIGVAALVWATQVRPTVQAAQANGLPGVNEALAQSGRQEPFPTDGTQAETEAASAPDHPILGDPAAGEALFAGTCSACHGPAGEGIPGLGKDLTANAFVSDKVDQELIDFVKVGRDPGDPLNTTGIGMPPKGGNPTLDDEDLQNIISYIRTLQK
jgi:mono/diheme cytochrome c family protein